MWNTAISVRTLPEANEMEEENKRFADRLREELLSAEGKARHCRIAEIAAIARFEGGGTDGNDLILVRSENEALVRKVFTLLQKAFNIVVEISMYTKHRSARTVSEIRIRDPKIRGILLKNLARPDLKRTCCRRAYLRGAFEAAGTISDPARYYRLEYVFRTREDADALMEIMRSLSLEGKYTARGRTHVVYLQDGQQLADAIALMDARYSVLELENIRVMRDMRGRIGRRVNCETSNLNKTVHASARQLRDIEELEESGVLESLPKTLQEAARLRKEYPDASLSELGDLMQPPVGRSGVNHRLRKIAEYAQDLRYRKEYLKNREEL